MKVSQISQRTPVTIGASASLGDAVERMCTERVGVLIVTRGPADAQTVAGVLTDRDVLRTQLQSVADLSQLSVADAMTADPLVVRHDEEVEAVLRKLQRLHLRRAPVIDITGRASGLLSVDDLLCHMAKHINSLAGVIARQNDAATDRGADPRPVRADPAQSRPQA